jgi:hypothetical protein
MARSLIFLHCLHSASYFRLWHCFSPFYLFTLSCFVLSWDILFLFLRIYYLCIRPLFPSSLWRWCLLAFSLYMYASRLVRLTSSEVLDRDEVWYMHLLMYHDATITPRMSFDITVGQGIVLAAFSFGLFRRVLHCRCVSYHESRDHVF